MFDKLFSEYNIKARVFPALICVLPLLLAKHYVVDQYFAFSLSQIVFGDISVALILVYFLAQVNRLISKALFEDKYSFPTDTKLLPSSKDLSKEYRNNLSVKIKQDFNLTLPSLREESDDITDVKLRIREIVKSIINKVKNGHLLYQHNIEYGFARNIMGGSVLAIIVSLINVVLFAYLFPNKALLIVSIVGAVIYAIPILLHKRILNHYSEEYSQVLFREYLKS